MITRNNHYLRFPRNDSFFIGIPCNFSFVQVFRWILWHLNKKEQSLKVIFLPCQSKLLKKSRILLPSASLTKFEKIPKKWGKVLSTPNIFDRVHRSGLRISFILLLSAMHSVKFLPWIGKPKSLILDKKIRESYLG